MHITFDPSKLTPEERAQWMAERKALQAQIANDQATNAKRDAQALARERAWLRRQAKENK